MTLLRTTDKREFTKKHVNLTLTGKPAKTWKNILIRFS